MAKERIFLVSSNAQAAARLESAVLTPAGFDTTIFQDYQTAEPLLRAQPPQVVIAGGRLAEPGELDASAALQAEYPFTAVLLLLDQADEALELTAFRKGLRGCISLSMPAGEIIQAVRAAVQSVKRLQERVNRQVEASTSYLRRQVEGLETLQRIGRSVTSLLDLDDVLKVVVDAAVDLTGAEEGSLLLLDENTGELYMRASRNFQEDFVRTFRLPIKDSLPGQVLRTGQPLLLSEDTPQKIKTAYLVYHLMYVPLSLQGRVIGVLGVDNRNSGSPFQDTHLTLMSTLADYAAVAIENAHIYSQEEAERTKLETILDRMGDGVLVVDSDGRIVLLNRTVSHLLNLNGANLSGRPAGEVIRQKELLELLSVESGKHPLYSEIEAEDGRIYNASLSTISGVGSAITLHDITHLKELDRIKSEFVNTVSHDLRSPLTAILGYVELIERVGAVNEQQREFIRRVQFSVNNITSLINDLLDLGRIEAGFDTLKESVPFASIVRHAVDGMRSKIESKKLDLRLQMAESLPNVLGNPARLHQMIENLLSNSYKYTPSGGQIRVQAFTEHEQVILRVADTGCGIPPTDQPFVFDKFYRASNVPVDSQGTGLGLAIVKSIVDNHQGRIWVDSSVNRGTMFTVMLPVDSR